jgi:hypothetical protein
MTRAESAICVGFPMQMLLSGVRFLAQDHITKGITSPKRMNVA